jgi:hypothetical protein
MLTYAYLILSPFSHNMSCAGFVGKIRGKKRPSFIEKTMVSLFSLFSNEPALVISLEARAAEQ